MRLKSLLRLAKSPKSLFKNKKVVFIIALLLVLLATCVPRIGKLFSTNDYFGYEQGIDYLIAKNIVIDHSFPLVGYEVGGVGGFSKGPGWNYLLTIPFILGGGEPFAGRIFIFFISAGTVLLAFFVVYRLFDLRAAIFSSFFLASSPSLINHAGNIWPPFVVPVLTVIFIYFLYKALANPTLIPLPFALTGIMVHFEIATAGLLFIQLSLVTAYLLIKKSLSFSIILKAIVVFLLTLAPLILYDLQHDFYNLKGIVSMVFAGGKSGSTPYPESGTSHLGTLIFNFKNSFTPHRLVGLPLALLLFIGTILYLRDKTNTKNRFFVLFLLLCPFTAFLILQLYPLEIADWWLLHLTVSYCLLTGILASYFWKKSPTKIITIIFILAFIKAFIHNTNLLLQKEFSYPLKESVIRSSVPIQYVFDDINAKSYAIDVVVPRKNKQEYEYLIWKKEYQLKKKGTANPSVQYVIIEVDPNNPVYFKRELEKYKGTTLLSTKVLGQNAFIVHKYLTRN